MHTVHLLPRLLPFLDGVLSRQCPLRDWPLYPCMTGFCVLVCPGRGSQGPPQAVGEDGWNTVGKTNRNANIMDPNRMKLTKVGCCEIHSKYSIE